MAVVLLSYMSIPLIIVWFLALNVTTQAMGIYAVMSLIPLFGGSLILYLWTVVNSFYVELATRAKSTLLLA